MHNMVFWASIIICVFAGSTRPDVAANSLIRERRQAARFFCRGQGYQEHHSDPRMYYLCRLYAPNVYVAYKYSCPDGQIFTAASQRCTAAAPNCPVDPIYNCMQEGNFCNAGNPAMPLIVSCEALEDGCFEASELTCGVDEIFCASLEAGAGDCQNATEVCLPEQMCPPGVPQ